jgi:hypothetical protein
MGTRRAIAVSSVTDGTTMRPGQATLRWSPPSDPVEGWAPSGSIYGHTSDQFGIADIQFAPDPEAPYGTLDWPGGAGAPFPSGVMVRGAQITVGASPNVPPPSGGSSSSSGGGAPSPPPSAPGTFTVQANTLVPVSRCDWPNCEADRLTYATVAATWSPY